MTDPKPPLDLTSLFPAIEQIADRRLREQVEQVWQALWAQSEWTDIEAVPTSGSIPYPTVPHNRCILDIALAIADAFEHHHRVRVDRDVLIAAAILQDASKVVEYRPGEDGKVERTELGRCYPHAYWAAHLANQHGIRDDVVHIIITHTPQASRFPDSIEGKILYYVDQLDVIAIHGDDWKKSLHITR
ncbi:MAG: hypothetical protein H6983_22505 [Ectothiorhodospiraceae bacterium]|nr:hypothetical protein [Chromatiales bacterium]MCP5156966.1 hypothetical protein [Ectothiorhodospiraceae bacterium]